MCRILRHVAHLACRARAFPLQSPPAVGVLCENLKRDMKHSRLFSCLGLAFLTLTFSAPSAAISMGRLRGASVLGQPLDLTVPLQMASGEDAVGLCVAAEVYFGDMQVDPAQVAASLGSFNGASAIRLSVRRPVDEPVVTIYVKTGCQQQSMRKYVLLSEFSSEIQHALPALEVVAETTKTVGRALDDFVDANATVVPPTRLASKREKPRVLGKVLSHSETAVAPPRQSVLPPSKVHAPAPQKKRADTGGARLKLLPLDLTQGWEPTLRLTDALTPPPDSVDERKRAEAAELWRAINASPEEILQEAGTRVALEAELRSLLAASRANQVAIAELNTQLTTAQENRLFNPIVFTLLALLLGCGVFLGVVYQRRRPRFHTQPWWAGDGYGSKSEELMSDGLTVRSVEPAISSSASSRQAAAESRHELSVHADVDIPLSDSAFSTGAVAEHVSPQSGVFGAAQSGVAAAGSIDFAHSVTGALRAINTQEMVDVRQQADFFLALGQHDDAADVLFGALGQSTESNPYIYLDLIALLHKLSRKEAYEKVRLAFNLLYTGNVPAYGAYSAQSLDLLDYPDLYAPLVQLWPTHAALDYIEQCLVRQSTDAADSGLGIESFKDLLLLHGILRSMLGGAAEASTPKAQIPKRVLPLFAGSQPTFPAHGFPVTAQTHSLDLDLS